MQCAVLDSWSAVVTTQKPQLGDFVIGARPRRPREVREGGASSDMPDTMQSQAS